MSIPVLVLLPPAGETPAERWVAEGRRAAARDLVARLAGLPQAGRLWFHAAEAEDHQALEALGARPFDGAPRPFHFGRTLAAFAAAQASPGLAYFGGASAPLASPEVLAEAFDRVAGAGSRYAVVNNYHSSDWVVLSQPAALGGLAEKLTTDNPLGWVLDHEAGYRVHAPPTSAATLADIDTPCDLLLIPGHPNLGPETAAFLHRAPPAALARTERLSRLLSTPASTLAIIGRSSSHIWQQLERRAQIWVRLFVEERGMVASGRAQRGQVRSLIGEMLETWGAREFVRRLEGMADGVLWDTRVWMAARGSWPTAADRFAADLGWADQVHDPALRELAQALAEATIPVITGGHSVVAGSLLALLETIAGSGAAATSLPGRASTPGSG